MNNNVNNEYLKDELMNDILHIRAKISLLQPLDIDYNVNASFLEGVKTISFEIEKILLNALEKLENIE